MNEIQEKYKDTYINDMREHLMNLNKLFVDFEHHYENVDLFNTIFRIVHTIKGNSSILQYFEIADLAHAIENLLAKVRNKEITLDQQIMDIIFESIDTTESMVNSIADSSEAVDQKEIIKKIEHIIGTFHMDIPPDNQALPDQTRYSGLSEEELQRVNDAASAGKNIYEIIVKIDTDCNLKSAKAALVIRELEKFATIITVHPSGQVIKQTGPDTFRVIIATDHDADVFKNSLQYLTGLSDVTINPFMSEKTNTLSTLNSVEDYNITEESEHNHPVSPASLVPVASPITRSIRIDIDQLDSLMNRIGELVINRIGMEYIISNYDDTELTESMEQFGRIIEELQADVMQIRMVPVDQIFNKYPRIVRDLAKNNDKNIKLIIEGTDIELDRTVLDKINDPLVHIIRNAVDHGIETPVQRQNAGKPETGIVHILARREKSHIIIEISDDGAGVTPEVIKRSAISRGLISEKQAMDMDDDEIVSLIFLPGLSTAKTVTDISGRGVGMEVVKRDIERMGGSIRVISTPGKGCGFEMKLPLTLAIIKVLVVRVGTHTFVVPYNSALETIRITNDQIKMLDINETFILRDEVIPLFRLNKLLSIESTCSPDDDLFVIIVERECRNKGLVVDELVGQQEVVIKSLGPSLGHVRGFAGATIIENGNVVLILDTNSLLT